MTLNTGDIERWIAILEALLRIYGDICDAYMIEYYVEKHEEKIPGSWRKYLATGSGVDMAKLLSATPFTSLAGQQVGSRFWCKKC